MKKCILIITIVTTIKMEKKKKYTINDKKQWASKPSTSPKEKLEIGKVFKVEIGEIRAIMIAAFVFDFFVLLSN